jgi:hypothetical protein
MQPVGVADARLPVAPPRTAGAGVEGACIAFDDVVVVALLGKLPPTPPNPTAKAIIVAPPISEMAFLASDFMRSGILHRVVFVPAGARGDSHRARFWVR